MTTFSFIKAFDWGVYL